MLQSKIIKDKYTDLPQVFTHLTELPEVEAQMAFKMIERWGMVAGMPSGEDSAGRSQLRLATPEELVDRAFACAELALITAREKGLMHEVGALDLSSTGGES